jgi:hypothetical protein
MTNNLQKVPPPYKLVCNSFTILINLALELTLQYTCATTLSRGSVKGIELVVSVHSMPMHNIRNISSSVVGIVGLPSVFNAHSILRKLPLVKPKSL